MYTCVRHSSVLLCPCSNLFIERLIQRADNNVPVRASPFFFYVGKTRSRHATMIGSAGTAGSSGAAPPVASLGGRGTLSSGIRDRKRSLNNFK